MYVQFLCFLQKIFSVIFFCCGGFFDEKHKSLLIIKLVKTEIFCNKSIEKSIISFIYSSFVPFFYER